MTIGGFIELVNNRRKSNKGQWVQVIESVNGKVVQYKAFNTWVQILKIQDCEYKLSGPMDCSVLKYKEFLKDTLTTYL
jgi:hypothetical protein